MKIFFIILLVFGLIGCSSTQSENVKSKAFFVSNDVRENAGLALATTTLFVGDRPGGTYLKLTGGDYVTCNGQRLSEDVNTFNQVQYKGSCGFVNQNTNYTFSLHLVSDNRDEVYFSSVTLPTPVVISSPAQGSRYKRGAPIQVAWNRDKGAIQVNMQGIGTSSESQGKSSIYSSYNLAQDPGVHVFSGADTNPKSISGEINNVSIQVRRKVIGVMDPDLRGEIVGVSESEVVGLKITP